MVKSAIERLVDVHPDMEIWWDSSPLVFEQWATKMVEAAPAVRKVELREQLSRLYNPAEPAGSIIRGCTTNPPLSLTAVQSDPSFWNEWIDQMIRANPKSSRQEYSWLTYCEVLRRGAERMMPIWESSNGRYGYISGQLDPRLSTDVDRMIETAKDIRSLAPNVMVKVPASTQGVEVVRALSAMAIPTNVTTCFTVAQVWAVANAAKEGLAIAEQNEVDTSQWRAVITLMIGRLIEHPVLDQQAARRGITLSWTDKHWAGIHTFRKAFRLLRDRGMPSKLLACSMRQGPYVGGRSHFWDVEKIAGGIVYTMPPYVLEPLFTKCDDLRFNEEILNDDTPTEVLLKMNRIPYMRQSWDENGIEVDQFNSHPATVATAELFSQASTGLEAYVGERTAVLT